MKNEKILEILTDPSSNKINVLEPRAYKKTFTISGQNLYHSLDGEYYFNFCSDVRCENSFKDNYKSFDKICVPSNIEFNGYGQLQYVNTQYPWDGRENLEITEFPLKHNYKGQYVKEFEFKCNDNEDNNYLLCFDGVESAFTVWLNGKYVGYNEDSFTRTEFDITKTLNEGKNVLAVEVYKYNVGSWLNDQDFWRLSGIFRSVGINQVTKYSVLDFDVDYKISDDLSTVELDISLAKNNDFEIEYSLVDMEDNVVCSGTTSSEIHEKLSGVELWSSENPYLYVLKVTTPSESFTHNIGFRLIELKGNQMFLNKQKLIIKGVNRHEFSSENGRAVTIADIIKDLDLLREMNVNAIRTSHYPNSPEFYELCDSYGFMVMDEVNLETHGTWFNLKDEDKLDNVLPNDNASYYNRVLDRVKNMYQRDKNFTSIIFWSLGNESYGGSTIDEMYKYLKNMDNSRIVHYEGIVNDRRFDSSDVESQMYTSSEGVKKFISESNCSKPFILCEFSHAMGNSNGNFDDYMSLIDEEESYHGGFIWEFNEQIINRNNKFNYGGDFGDRPSDFDFICDGVVSDYQRRTPEFYYIKNMYSPLKITETEEYILVKNQYCFKNIENLTVEIFESSIAKNQLVKLMKINLKSEFEIKKIRGYSNLVYRFKVNNNVLKEYSVKYSNNNTKNNFSNVILTQEGKTKFVDGVTNFGMYGENFEIMFSKNHNKLISLKYSGLEIFKNIDTVFSPNYYRALTNNDKGANVGNELGILKHISYNFTTRIESYEYKNNVLIVKIVYQSTNVEKYKAMITYEISNSGTVKITLTADELPTNRLFNFGVKASLNNKFTNFTYLGNGPYDSYIDRSSEMAKAFYNQKINEDCPYVIPQEYGNKTNVDQVVLFTEEKNAIKLMMSQADVSIKAYTDLELDSTTNVHELNKGAPFIRINSIQTGVGGDDSWGSWAKDRYIAKTSQVKPLVFTISKL